MMNRGYQHNWKDKLQSKINETHRNRSPRSWNKTEQARKRNFAFRDTIPALSVYCKRNFNGKVQTHTKRTATLLIFLKNHPLFPTRKENPQTSGKEHACYSQNIKGQHTVSRQYRCAACHPLQFFAKNNLHIQKVRVGVSLSVQLTSLHYFLWCPVITRETKFAFAIKALVKYTIMLHNDV